MYINRYMYSRKYEDVEQTYGCPVTRGSSACTQSPSRILQFLAILVLYKCNCMWRDREADGSIYSINIFPQLQDKLDCIPLERRLYSKVHTLIIQRTFYL